MRGRGSIVGPCERCGQQFKRTPSRHIAARFCSRVCRKTVVNETCRTCGIGFAFAPSQRNRYQGSGMFCSRACVSKAPGSCAVCGTALVGYGKKYCPVHAHKSYLLMSPIQRKAWSMGAPIIGGQHKSQAMLGLLYTGLDAPCPYCAVTLTLSNISLDHIEPYNAGSSGRWKLPRAFRERCDRLDNLQMVCRKCNGLKGNFSDSEYRRVLALVASDPILGNKLMSRLRQASANMVRLRQERAA